MGFLETQNKLCHQDMELRPAQESHAEISIVPMAITSPEPMQTQTMGQQGSHHQHEIEIVNFSKNKGRV